MQVHYNGASLYKLLTINYKLNIDVKKENFSK